MGKFEDLTGKKFGRLTVIRKCEKRKNGKVMWECICDCGSNSFVYAPTSNLKNGNTQSCGCLQKLKTSQAVSKGFNEYVNIENYCKVFDEKDNHFLISREDLELVKKYRWYLTKRGYWASYNPKLRKRIMLHRLICKTKAEVVDHINGNKNDNRRENLRPASIGENCMNRSITDKNTSGIIGVSKNGNSWVATISVNNRTKYLGCSKDKEKIIKTRLEAEAKYFGEFAPQKHLFEQYGIKGDN